MSVQKSHLGLLPKIFTVIEAGVACTMAEASQVPEMRLATDSSMFKILVLCLIHPYGF